MVDFSCVKKSRVAQKIVQDYYECEHAASACESERACVRQLYFHTVFRKGQLRSAVQRKSFEPSTVD